MYLYIHMCVDFFVKYVYVIIVYHNALVYFYCVPLHTSIWGFPKMMVPNWPMGFPTKNDHFGVFWGYHHLRKPPYSSMYLQIIPSKILPRFKLQVPHPASTGFATKNLVRNFPEAEGCGAIKGGVHKMTGWWLNQPIWKILSSNWVHLPQSSGWT